MKSHINEDFLKAYRRLPKEIREQARIYSARISRGYRTIGIRTDDVIIWFWIGSHTDYDKLIASL